MLSLEEIKKFTEKTFARASGPGGQNVNKSESRVTLVFDILGSSLEPVEKQRLLRKYPNGFLHVYNQETRSQHQNLELAYQHLFERIEQGLFLQKARKKTVAPYQTRSGKKSKVKKAHLLKYKKRYLE